jgi:predicted TIM-barrel fold metal-dependent hydrolase
MPENSHRRRLKGTFRAVFIISWIGLFLWAFPSVRMKVRFAILKTLGYTASLSGEAVPEDISLSEFRPVSMMVPVRENIPEYPRYPVVEFHGHIFPTYTGNLEADLTRCRTALFINLALRTYTLDGYIKLKKKYPETIVLHFPGWNYTRLKKQNNESGVQQMAADLEALAKAGIRGVKLWKNLGLMEKKPDGTLYAIDDPIFDPLWDVAAKYHLVIAIHTADPPAFFQKPDGTNERFEELSRHPEWSFLKGPGFDEVLAQRDRLFERRRDVKFVALHFGELAHDLKRASLLLDRNPNVWIDTAQRIDELGRQPGAARQFFLKYQDRILYGTDGLPDYEKVRIYWRFFETDDEYFDYHPAHKDRKGLWKISGLSLPDDVLRKIYYQNALKLIGISEQEFLKHDPLKK